MKTIGKAARVTFRRAVALAAWFASAATAAAAGIDGTYVFDGAPQIVAGRLEATETGSARDLKLDVMFRRLLEQNALKRYDSFDRRGMKWTIVDDALDTVLDREIVTVIDGHAQSRVRFPKPGLYHVFVDGQPRAIPRQILRFDLDVDPPSEPAPPRSLAGPVTDADIGPYHLHFDSLDLAAGRDGTITLHIDEGDKPARDLKLIQGVLADPLMVSASDLRYVPVTALWPGDHDPVEVPATISFAVEKPPAGTYRLFVSFNGPRLGFTAPFVAVAR